MAETFVLYMRALVAVWKGAVSLRARFRAGCLHRTCLRACPVQWQALDRLCTYALARSSSGLAGEAQPLY